MEYVIIPFVFTGYLEVQSEEEMSRRMNLDVGPKNLVMGNKE